MQGNSSPVHSSQLTVHPRLPELWARRIGKPFQRPLLDPPWWSELVLQLRARPRRILDLGCGTGASTLALAARHPESLCIGIDASIARLARTAPALQINGLSFVEGSILVHGDSVNLLGLCAQAAINFDRVLLLYPNPWPKAAQLTRRWHAHPLFPLLLSISEEVEMRCNWNLYAEEFAWVANQLGHHAELADLGDAVDSVQTPFERKYRASGHALWRVVVRRSAETSKAASLRPSGDAIR